MGGNTLTDNKWIPKTFTLGAQKFTIKCLPNDDHEDEVFATCMPDYNAIFLWAPFFEMPQSRQEQTLWHEITHALLHVHGNDLWNDEGHVESLSVLIHQLMKTLK